LLASRWTSTWSRRRQIRGSGPTAPSEADIFFRPFARRPQLYYPTGMAEPRDVLRLVQEGANSSSEGVDSSGVVSSGQSEHALLMAGKITFEDYLDMTVDRALAHVRGQVSSARLL